MSLLLMTRLSAKRSLVAKWEIQILLIISGIVYPFLGEKIRAQYSINPSVTWIFKIGAAFLPDLAGFT